MRNRNLGKIRLNEDETKAFVNSLFFPTQEESKRRDEVIEQRKQCIHIQETDHGFEAEIADLDLSFLDGEAEKEWITVTVSMLLKPKEDVFYSVKEQYREKEVFLREDNVLISYSTNELDDFAA